MSVPTRIATSRMAARPLPVDPELSVVIDRGRIDERSGVRGSSVPEPPEPCECHAPPSILKMFVRSSLYLRLPREAVRTRSDVVVPIDGEHLVALTPAGWGVVDDAVLDRADVLRLVFHPHAGESTGNLFGPATDFPLSFRSAHHDRRLTAILTGV